MTSVVGSIAERPRSVEASRNSVIGPEFANIDVAVQRAIAMKERYTILLRAESFNVATKANFMNPLRA